VTDVSAPDRRTLVGRADELARLERVVERARRGHRAVALVGGEAGIGKTRLVTELGRRAGDSGALVLVGGCLDLDDGGIPYAPVVEALGPLLAAVDDDGSDHLGLTMRRALERAGAGQPVLFVIEDVHWADRSTRDLIAYLATAGPELPLALVVTYRSDDLHAGHPLRRFRAELERRPHVVHVRLARFGRADVAQLLTIVLGGAPRPEVVDTIFRRSEGNPFFVEELALAGTATTEEELPPLLRDVLMSRVEQLSSSTQAVLRIAAVGGRRIDHDRLAAVAELDDAALTHAVREAQAANVITVDPSRRRYEFRHALLHEAVYSDVLPGERSRYHVRYAEAIGAGTGTRRIEEWAELAHHWRVAGQKEPALVATLEAALAADAGYAPSEAYQYYELALQLWSGLDEPPRAAALDYDDLLMRTADSASRTGAFGRAVELTTAAIEAVDADLDPTAAGLLHERRAWFLWRTGLRAEALDEYGAAVRLVPASPASQARARVLAAYADALERRGRYAEACDVATDAIDIALDVGSTFDEGHARHMFGLALAALGQTEAGIIELHRARVLAERNGDVADVAGTYVHLWRVLSENGRAEEMVHLAADAAEFCRAADLTVASVLLDCLGAAFLLQLGRWDEARARLDHEEVGGVTAAVWNLVRGLLAVEQGELDAGREHLETARYLSAQVHDGRINGLLYRGLAELALWQGRPTDALDTILTGLTLTGDEELQARLVALGLRADADVAERQRAAGQTRPAPTPPELLDALARLGELAEARQAPWASEVRASAELGAAERTRRAGTSDPERWADVVRRWDALGFPSPAAYARWRLADATLARGRRTDAAPLWREAHAAAVRLGVAGLVAAIEAAAGRAAVPLTDEGEEPAPYGLTARELEVLVLVAAGQTNRQIGEALFISEKTASVHVSHILAKLDASSRAQAAALASRLGLAGRP
jgi:DNA-binding CsgD family transcriptional regulator/tetratricopeptide (TPR) repeat protein